MIVKVHMLAFGSCQIREVDIPDNEWQECTTTEHKLDAVFHWGQNDFQPKPCPSVSVGDVIELDGRYHMVEIIGFNRIPNWEEFKKEEARNKLFALETNLMFVSKYAAGEMKEACESMKRSVEALKGLLTSK